MVEQFQNMEMNVGRKYEVKLPESFQNPAEQLKNFEQLLQEVEEQQD